MVAGNPGFPRLVMVTSGRFSWCLLEARNTLDLGGASWDSTGLCAVEEGLISSGEGKLRFLSYSDVGLRVCMPFQTGSQVSTCVEAWNSAFLSSCQRGFRPPADLNLGPGALLGLTNTVSELLSFVSLFSADI